MPQTFPSRAVAVVFPTLASLLLAGCAGSKGRWMRSPLKLEPASAEVTWREGLGYMACPDPGLDLRAAFEGVRAGHLRFSVKARNGGAAPFELDPRGFRLRHPLPPPDSVDRRDQYVFLADSSAPDTLSLEALEPVRQRSSVRQALDGLEREKNPHRRENQSVGGAVLVGVLRGITEALTAPKGETPAQAQAHRDEEEREREESRREDAEQWDAEHRQELERLRDEETLWRKLALARTTLEPGQSAEGLVVFPMDPRMVESTRRWVILDTSLAGREKRALRDSLEKARPFVSRLAVPTGGTPCVLPFLQVRPTDPDAGGEWTDPPPRTYRR